MAVFTRESHKRRPGSSLRRFFLGFRAAFVGLLFVIGVAWLIGRDDPATAVGLVLFYVLGAFLWWRFIRPLRLPPEGICPECGELMETEGDGDPICPHCQRETAKPARTSRQKI